MPPKRNRPLNDVYEKEFEQRVMARTEERLDQFVDQLADRMNNMMNKRRHGDRNGRGSKDEQSENPFFEGDGYRQLKRLRRNQREDNRRWEFGIRVNILMFDGDTLNPEGFIDWLVAVEEVFEFKEVPENKKVSLIATKLRGNGYQERDKNKDKIGQNQARDWKEREITSPTPITLKDDSETVIDSNNDYFLSDADSYENIDYVDASPPDAEIVNIRVVEIVIPEVGGIDDDILLTIKDDILREKLLNVNLLIANIEALKDNPTPSSDFVTKSSSTSLNLFLEETNTVDKSLTEYETFRFNLEEISSGSTNTQPDPGDLIDPGIRGNVSSTTNVNLPFRGWPNPPSLWPLFVWILFICISHCISITPP
ncbi:hypothetical protein Tco_0077928 [Tanacetum coccineum]